MKKSRRHPNYTHKTPYTHVYSSSTDLEGTNPYKIPSCATSTFRETEGLQKAQTPVIPRNYTHETYEVSWEEHTARVFHTGGREHTCPKSCDLNFLHLVVYVI